MPELVYKQEAFEIIGICMEVHRNLGGGFMEIVYKDALDIEFKNVGISYQREKQYQINYIGNNFTT